VPGPLPVSQGDENFYALSYFLRDVIPEKFMIDDLPEKRCMQMTRAISVLRLKALNVKLLHTLLSQANAIR